MKQYHIVETNNKQLLLLEGGSYAFIPESGHFEEISIKESIESVHENEILKMKCREFVGSNIKTDIIYFYSKKKYGIIFNKRYLILEPSYERLHYIGSGLFEAEVSGYKGIIDINSYCYIVKGGQYAKLNCFNAVVTDFTPLSKIVVKTYGKRGLLDNEYNELTKISYDNIEVFSRDHSSNKSIIYEFTQKDNKSIGFHNYIKGLNIIENCSILNDFSYYIQDGILLCRGYMVSLYSLNGNQLLPFEYIRIEQIKGTNIYITTKAQTNDHEILKNEGDTFVKVSNDNLVYCCHTDHDTYGQILCIIQDGVYRIKNMEGKILADIKSIPEGYHICLYTLTNRTIECSHDNRSCNYDKYTEYITIDFNGNEVSRRREQIVEWGDDDPDDSTDWESEYYGAFEDDPSAEWR